LEKTIPVRNWRFGDTKTQGQKAIAVQVGETTIGFTVQEAEMRGLGRTLISASWKGQSASTLRSLLGLLLMDFARDVRGWGSVLSARLRASSRRRIASFAFWISGRSLRIFRTVIIAPNAPIPKYDPVHKCIYCDAEVYSTDPGGRLHPLGGEHIIAEALGGTIELLLASCQKCERATGSIVENDVLGRTLKALRGLHPVRLTPA
jgi:hypothetical protein